MSRLLSRAGLEYSGDFVQVGATRIHYLNYGAPNDRPPVLLLHGGGAGSAIWYRQIAELAKTRQVVAPDHPVFGLSDQIPFEEPLLDGITDYIVGFMDALELDRVDVVALSMGGQGAIAACLTYPERFRRLVLIGSAGLGAEFPLVFKLSLVPFFGRLITRPNRWGQDTYFKTFEVKNTEFEGAEEYKQYAYDVTLSRGHSKAKRKSLKSIANWAGQINIITDEALAHLDSPTLAIWGDDDQLFPVSHAERLVNAAPNAHLEVIENAAHVPLLDNSDRVTELITRFVNG